MSYTTSHPKFPAVLLSPADRRRQYLDAFAGRDPLPSVQLRHFIFRNMVGAMLVDSDGKSHRITNLALRGISWKHYASASLALNLVLLPIGLFTLGLMVRIDMATRLDEPITLNQLKSEVLACMAKSTTNFKGRGGVTEWRAPVNTAHSFSQLVGRLSLLREAA